MRRWLRERGYDLEPLADAPPSFRWTLLEILSGPNHDLDYKPSSAVLTSCTILRPTKGSSLLRRDPGSRQIRARVGYHLDVATTRA